MSNDNKKTKNSAPCEEKQEARQLSEEELAQVSGGSNISTMLEGKVAGVQITSDGRPGAEMTIRVRGTRSITGSNEPLYVVD